MLKINVKYINDAERLLRSFQGYSYFNYGQLLSVITKLKASLDETILHVPRQLYLDLAFEIDEVLESLTSLRYAADKDDDFASYVCYVLSMISRLKPYLPGQEPVRRMQYKETIVSAFIKRLSISLKHV